MKIQAVKERLKHIFTPRVLTIVACAVAGLLICAGGYCLIRYSVWKESYGTQNNLAVTTPSGTPFSPASPSPHTCPTCSPAAAETYQVLSVAELHDGRRITYSYGEDQISAMMGGEEIWRITFDEKGNMQSQIYIGLRGISEIGMPGFGEKHYYLCEYDNAGRLIKRSLYADGYENNDLLVCRTVFRYDSNGNLLDTQTEYTEPLPKSGTVTYEANKWGYLKKTYVYDPDEYDYELIYDFRGNLVKKICNKVMEYEDFVEMYFFDENHQTLEAMKIQERFDRKGATVISGSYLSLVDLEYRFLYDPDGQLQPASFFGSYWNAEPYTREHISDDSCTPEYDAAGRLIRCAHDPNEYFWREYEFDENQKLIKQIHHIFNQAHIEADYEYGSDGRLRRLTRENTEYYYDEKGRVCQYKEKVKNLDVVLDLVFDTDGRAYMKKWTFTSDTEALPLQSVEYFYDTEFERIGTHFCFPEENGGSSVYEYDANGFKKREIYYDTNGAFLIRKEYSYNEQGWMIRGSEYDESGVLLGWLECRHNDIGECIGWDYYTDEGKQLSDTEWKYDELGGSIKITYREDRTEKSRGLYEYDKNGCVNGYSDSINTYTFTEVPEQVYRIYARCNFDELILCNK